MNKKKYWQIRNAKSDTPEILIYEEIGYDWFFEDGIGAKQFVEDLKALGDPTSITVRINSPGGDVFDGYAIYNALKSHKATINVHIDGLAASIASVIAMAGDTVEMPDNALMMIHMPMGSARGTAKDMRKTAEALDKVTDGIITTYQTRSNLEDEALRDMLDAETWISAREAVEWGFADTVAEPVKMAACLAVDWKYYGYRRVPQQIQPSAGETPRLNQYKSRFAGIEKAKQRLRFAQEIADIRQRRKTT